MSHLAAWEQRVTLGHLGLIRLVPSVCWRIHPACLPVLSEAVASTEKSESYFSLGVFGPFAAT